LSGQKTAPAPEARQKVAHGETVGLIAKINPSPERGERNFWYGFLSPLPELEIFLND
jgi:hypothetical protein